MAANKIIHFNIALTTTNATSLVLPGTTTGTSASVKTTVTNLQITFRRIRLINTSATPTTASLFIGAAATAAAGTEFIGSAIPVAGNSFVEWFGSKRIATGETAAALCGGSAVATITLEGEGEIGVA